MKAIVLALTILLTLSLLMITAARPETALGYGDLRQDMIDYLLEAERREALYDQRRLLAKHMQRREEEAFVASQGGNADNYERTNVRRKAVGLGDNPFK